MPAFSAIRPASTIPTVALAALLSVSCQAQPASQAAAPPAVERASEPFWSFDDRRIVFTGGAYPETDLYVADADGANVVRLTDHPAADHYGSLSPDGARVLFSSNRGGTWEVWVMNADGSDPVALAETSTQEGDPMRPVWSPDGRHIAYTVLADGRRDLYVMDADGANPRLITEDGRDPAWSPDGTRLAFTSERDGQREVYAVNLDGTGLTRITDNDVRDSLPSWSPDGTRLAYLSGAHGPPNWEVYTIRADGTDPQRITENEDWDFYPVWSPVGGEILFVSIRDGDDEPQLYVMNADGTDVRKLTLTPVGTEASDGGAQGTLLRAPYPNPTHGTVRIPYALGEAQRVGLALYDARGKRVADVLSSRVVPAGLHAVTADLHTLSAGLYWVRLVTSAPERGVLSRALVLVR